MSGIEILTLDWGFFCECRWVFTDCLGKMELLPFGVVVVLLVYLDDHGRFFYWDGLRFVRSKIRGTRYVRVPDGLVNAIGNQQIVVGTELVVADDHEWRDVTVVRYSIRRGLWAMNWERCLGAGAEWMEVRSARSRED